MADEPVRTIDRKLAEVMAEVAYVHKASRNEYHKYNYASAEDVLQKINAALSSRGLSIEVPPPQVNHFAERDKKVDAVVTLRFSVHDSESGEVRSFSSPGQGRDAGDKAIGKAITNAHKYLYAQAFCISWGDDPEADTSTDRDAAAKPAPKARKNGKPKGAPKKAFPTDAEVITMIEHAADAETLAEIRKNMTARSAPARPKEVVDAYQKRRKELEKEGAAA